MVADAQAVALVHHIVALALDHGASDPVALDVSERTPFADAFVILTAETSRNAAAIAEHLIDELREQGLRLRAEEGRESGSWVLLDFGSVIVHIFLPEQREYYGLERVWRESPVLELPGTSAETAAGAETAAQTS